MILILILVLAALAVLLYRVQSLEAGLIPASEKPTTTDPTSSDHPPVIPPLAVVVVPSGAAAANPTAAAPSTFSIGILPDEVDDVVSTYTHPIVPPKPAGMHTALQPAVNR